MKNARQTVIRTAPLFNFTVTDDVPTYQDGTGTTPWWDMPLVLRTQFTLTIDGAIVCDIRVKWDGDDVAEYSIRDGGGIATVSEPRGELNGWLFDAIAKAQGMATYFANNPDFDGGA